MMKCKFFIVSAAWLLAGTTFASAQVWDDPPGYAWQRRGMLDSQGMNPNRPYGGFGYYGDDAYGAYGAVPGYNAYRTAPGWWNYGYVQPDIPPGSRFQDRGISEDLGRNPLNYGQ